MSQPAAYHITLAAPTAIPSRKANTVQVMKMAQALSHLGHTVSLLAPRPVRTNDFNPPSWEMLAEHYGLSQPFSITWLTAHPAFKRYDYALQAVDRARREHCDLFYTRLIQSAAFASLLGLPTLLEVHDLPSGWVGPLFFKAFLSGRGARRLAVITRALGEDLTRLLGAPPLGSTADAFCLLAPDGVDLERYAQLPSPAAARAQLKHLKLQPGTFTAGYTGHLYPGRGTDLLLALAAALPQVQFLLVGGEPPDIERLQQTIHQRDLHNIHLAGFIPNAALPLYQAACDALLMPYGPRVAASSGGNIARYLSPMKLFEYMACERPILSSDLSVLREVLSPGNALLLPPEDPTAWVEALRRLLDDPSLRTILAQQARRDVTQYSWDARASSLIAGLKNQNTPTGNAKP